MSQLITTVVARADDAAACAVLEELREPTQAAWKRDTPDPRPPRPHRLPSDWKDYGRFLVSRCTVKTVTVQILRIAAGEQPGHIMIEVDVRPEFAVYVTSGDIRPRSFRVWSNDRRMDEFPHSLVVVTDAARHEVRKAANELIATFILRTNMILAHKEEKRQAKADRKKFREVIVTGVRRP